MSLGLLTSSIRTLKNLKNVQYDQILGLVSSRISPDDEDYSHILKRKSKLQLVLISAAVCGIEFCYAAETAFVSPTLLKIGVHVVYMTLIWCLSPLFGFLLVPLFGSLSDRCKFKLGRRRPFILLLSTGIILGLLLVPNGKTIGIALGDIYPERLGSGALEQEDHTLSPEDTSNSKHLNSSFRNILNIQSSDSDYKIPSNNTSYDSVALEEFTRSKGPTNITQESASLPPYPHPWSILFTVVGVVMLDFSCDACQSPCRAYMLDVTVPADHPNGLSTFTVMAGLGGAFGYVMGGINWEGTHIGESMGGHVRVVFTLVLFIYLICLSLTVTSVREVPLEKLGFTKEQLQKKKKKVHGDKYKKFMNEDDDEDEDEIYRNNKVDYGSQKETPMEILTDAAETTSADHGYQTMETDHLRADKMSFEKGMNQNVDTKQYFVPDTVEPSSQPSMPMATEVTLKTYLVSIMRMPRSLIFLCLTNLFCWMSLVCYSLYFTDFVGQAVYGGDPSAREGSEEHRLYEEGVRMGSFGMSLYSLSCSMYSLSIEKLVKTFGARPVYICSQLVYTVGMIILAAWRGKIGVILLSPTAGVMYATLFTMPYLLVAHYHSNDTFEELVDGKTRSQQVRGLGTDIALVSSMVFLAQFILSACMGSIIHAVGSTVAVVVCAAVLSFCGAITATQVLYLDL